MRYRSAFARDSFDFETLGAAIVGSSSPGILCLIIDPANRPRKNTTGEQKEECTTLSRLPRRGSSLEIHALTTLALWPDESRKAATVSFPVSRRSEQASAASYRQRPREARSRSRLEEFH